MFVSKLRPSAVGLALAASLAVLVLRLLPPAGRGAGGDVSRGGDRVPHGAGRARDQPGAAGAPEARSRRSRSCRRSRPAGPTSGLLLLRQQEIEPAKERLTKAAELAPRSAAIERLLAIAESRAGNSAESIRHWRRALELEPGDVKAAYALAQEVERQGTPESDAEAQRDARDAARAAADNLPARLDAIASPPSAATPRR